MLSQVVVEMDKDILDRQMSTSTVPTSPPRLGKSSDFRSPPLLAKTLTTFFVDKLSERASLQPCATALTELVKSPPFGTGEGVEVAKGCVFWPPPLLSLSLEECTRS